MSETREMYFDLDGNPMTLMEWAKLLERKRTARGATEDGDSSPEDDPTRIGSDHISEDEWVSTVWLGLNHNWGNGPPLIFETMVFGGKHDQWQDRYATKEAALAGHDRVVAALKSGADLE